MPIIRRARPDEYAAVGRLTAAAYAPVLTFGSDDPYRAVLMDAASRAAAAELWVAEVDGEIVGTVTVCRPESSYAEVAGPDELEVRMLAIDPGAQRAGVGGSLMSEVHQVARAEGFAAVVLSVVETNAPAAAFYRGLGYQREPARDWTPVPNVRLEVWGRGVELT